MDRSQNNKNEDITEESMSEKTGYEASDIIEDALQLAVDDELKEDREDITTERGFPSKVNIKSTQNEVNPQKYNEDSAPEQTKGMLSPPKPETAPVVAPLTLEDKIAMDTSKLRNTGTDDASMIVNLDDTQSDIIDTDNDQSLNANDSNDSKSNRKLNNENNCIDSNTDSIIDKKNSSNDETKDMNKISEKDSSKAKSSSNQKENKVKTKESKNGAVPQKGQTASNGRNIWVSGLSQNTKACELQTIFSKHGKVVSAKIIKNARMSGSRCYGFITMESNEQVLKCIAQLNKTELHGRTIALSRNRPQENTKSVVTRSKAISVKRDVNKNSKESEVKEKKSEEKTEENVKTKRSSEERHKTVSESGSKTGSEAKVIEKRKPIRAPFRDRPPFPRRPIMPMRRPIPFRRPFPNNNIRGFHRNAFVRGGMGGIRPNFVHRVPDFDRNLRERERRIREERRRREESLLRANFEEREERMRLEREKERLKMERLNLEREKAEFQMRFEREKAKLEREKIEREREELRRRQQNQTLINQHRVHPQEDRSRSTIMSSTLKRPFESRDMRSTDPLWEERKRFQMQRIDTHLISNRQNYVDSGSSVGNRHSISQYDNRNDYKRNPRIEMSTNPNTRTEFDSRRDTRHTIGHDRDDRKNSGGPSYYRGESSRGRDSSFLTRERRFGSQREDSRRSERYSDRMTTGGTNSGFGGNSRFGSESRWSDRPSNSINRMSYGSGNVHMSGGGQQWTPSSGHSSHGRWNSAINSSSESRSRGQPSLNPSMLSGTNPSITDLFGSAPMSGIQLDISHPMAGSAGNNMGSGERTYIHSNRRF